MHVVRYSRPALSDIEEAVQYYESRRTGLGLRFAAAVLDKVDVIADNPLHTSLRYAEVHCRKVSGFPYLIHYTVEESPAEVIIEAVYNTHRQPLWE